jgi:hypothetical protein
VEGDQRNSKGEVDTIGGHGSIDYDMVNDDP